MCKAATCLEVNAGAEGDAPVVRVDDVVPLTAKVYLLKVDAQGHDRHVLEGAQRLLAAIECAQSWWSGGQRHSRRKA